MIDAHSVPVDDHVVAVVQAILAAVPAGVPGCFRCPARAGSSWTSGSRRPRTRGATSSAGAWRGSTAAQRALSVHGRRCAVAAVPGSPGNRRAGAALRVPLPGEPGRGRRRLPVRRQHPSRAGRAARVVAAPGRGPPATGAHGAARPPGLGGVRPGHRRSDWSPGVYRIFERDPAQGPMSRAEQSAAMLPDDRGLSEAAWQTLDSGAVSDVTVRFQLGRSVKVLRILSDVARDVDGAPVKIYAMIQDVPMREESRTEIERLSDQLRRREITALAEHRLAAQLQNMIQPVPPAPFRLTGLEAIVNYLPAESALQVGGDWYHAQTLPDGPGGAGDRRRRRPRTRGGQRDGPPSLRAGGVAVGRDPRPGHAARPPEPALWTVEDHRDRRGRRLRPGGADPARGRGQATCRRC